MTLSPTDLRTFAFPKDAASQLEKKIISASAAIDAKLIQLASDFTFHQRFHFSIFTPYPINDEVAARLSIRYGIVGWGDLKVTDRGESATGHITTFYISI